MRIVEFENECYVIVYGHNRSIFTRVIARVILEKWPIIPLLFMISE